VSSCTRSHRGHRGVAGLESRRFRRTTPGCGAAALDAALGYLLPDRRLKNNPRLRIMLYGSLGFISRTGLNMQWYCSRPAAAHRLAYAISSYVGPAGGSVGSVIAVDACGFRSRRPPSTRAARTARRDVRPGVPQGL